MTPDPTKYHPRYNFNENVKSDHLFRGSTKFSKSKLKFVDELWRTDEKCELPAPG